jgi:hypothetical protein
MTPPPLRFMLLLVGAALLQRAPGLAAAEPPPAKGAGKVTGARISFPDKTLEQVAAAWLRMFGETATVAEHLKARRVTLQLAASSKEELRRMMVDSLREQGVAVVARSNGVEFDRAPEVKPGK